MRQGITEFRIKIKEKFLYCTNILTCLPSEAPTDNWKLSVGHIEYDHVQPAELLPAGHGLDWPTCRRISRDLSFFVYLHHTDVLCKGGRYID